MLGSAKSEHPRLTNCDKYSKYSNLCDHGYFNVMDKQTESRLAIAYRGENDSHAHLV